MGSYGLNLRPGVREALAEAASQFDMDAVRRTATNLVRLVLTEDYVYMDALPDLVQVNLLTPLGMLSEALRDEVDDSILLGTVRAVCFSAEPVLADCPPDMRELIEALPHVS
jgi:hypothetical protein